MHFKILVLAAISCSTIIGIIIGLIIRKVPHRYNDTILGFAAGVMLAASILGLLYPALTAIENTNLIIPIAGAFTGALLISFLDKIIPHLHRIAGIETEHHKNNKSFNKVLLFTAAIALHKIPEGIATGVSFGSSIPTSTLTVASAISIQNIPEAIVIVSPLLAIGITPMRVIAISISIAAVSIASVICGMLLVDIFAFTIPFMTAAAGGAMLYVISDEMIPETHAHGHEKEATFALLTGLILVIILQSFLDKLF